jgi:hypothetical protein
MDTETEPDRDELQLPGKTAAEKVESTLRELSRPDDDAGELELSLASVAMAMERGLAEKLAEQQASGELDAFMLSLTRFLAMHRSDDARALIVVELPRRELPSGTRLHLLDQAIEAQQKTMGAPW